LKRPFVRRSLLFSIFVAIALGGRVFFRLKAFTAMPGSSFEGALEPFDAEELSLAERLEERVRFLAVDVGPRAFEDFGARARVGAWISQQATDVGLVARAEAYEVSWGLDLESEIEPPPFYNYIISLGGPPDAPLLIVSAHFDTVPGSPGADDDATGVAALLELAGRFARTPLTAGKYRVELCFFDGEEAGKLRMGSRAYANHLNDLGASVAGAISLEMLGTYTEEPDTQTFPSRMLTPFYPDTGNFLAFVGSESSGEIIRSTLGAFRKVAKFPSEGFVAPDSMPDVGRSDHASFWAHGWPGLMITDTANFRNMHYHKKTDTPDRVDFLRLARVTNGLEKMLRMLNREGI